MQYAVNKLANYNFCAAATTTTTAATTMYSFSLISLSFEEI